MTKTSLIFLNPFEFEWRPSSGCARTLMGAVVKSSELLGDLSGDLNRTCKLLCCLKLFPLLKHDLYLSLNLCWKATKDEVDEILFVSPHRSGSN